MLSVFSFAISIIYKIISTIVSVVCSILNVNQLVGSLFGLLIVLVFYGFAFVLMIIGIMNASNGKEEELPVIGQFAFYK